ncbi:hypothetical protein J1N35_010348 [Gossypium stocksii]|uniref:Uncharacterized protein n=1 Tax=Gossypium stocksii TaxID=47602 RepID=A0A9D3W231_9ROSI|nr:hypothetical protein J1N35_010348 [Gossypium stocksii]
MMMNDNRGVWSSDGYGMRVGEGIKMVAGSGSIEETMTSLRDEVTEVLGLGGCR